MKILSMSHTDELRQITAQRIMQTSTATILIPAFLLHQNQNRGNPMTLHQTLDFWLFSLIISHWATDFIYSTWPSVSLTEMTIIAIISQTLYIKHLTHLNVYTIWNKNTTAPMQRQTSTNAVHYPKAYHSKTCHKYSSVTLSVHILMPKTPFLSMTGKWKIDPRSRSVPKSN